MEELTNVQETENLTSDTKEPDALSPCAGGDKKEELEKKFTQADVDRIVRERLKRRSEKEENENNAQFQQREAELTQRESRLACKEYLLDNSYPKELLDVIDTSDFEQFKTKANTALSAISSMRAHPAPPLFRYSDSGEDIGAAFSNTKHTPRKY